MRINNKKNGIHADAVFYLACRDYLLGGEESPGIRRAPRVCGANL